MKKYFVDSSDYLVQQDAYLDPGLPWNDVWSSPAQSLQHLSGKLGD